MSKIFVEPIIKSLSEQSFRACFVKCWVKRLGWTYNCLRIFFNIFVRLLLWNRPITSNIWVKLTKNTHDYYLIRHVIFAYCWNKCLGLIICLGFLLFYLIYNRKYMFSSQIHQVVGVLFLGLSVILKKKLSQITDLVLLFETG